MNPTRKLIAGLLAGSLLLLAPFGAAQGKKKKKAAAKEEGPVVQIAILLDTSGSMSGLIDQAKTQLWKVVNEFIGSEQAGKSPVVQVALYEYGNNGLDAENHWIREIQPLTRDLDKVSEELFALKTNGGKEYCGAVIRKALTELQWDKDANTFKTIFIAGNEPFTQGPVDAAQACRDAVGKGITINTIHCGPESTGVDGKWKMGALLADGNFTIIDQNRAAPVVDAPQDKEIAELNAKLNDTYIAFGKKAERLESKERQIASDEKAKEAAPAAAAQRAVTKASANYYNAKWDVVDAWKEDPKKISEIPEEELPEELKKLSKEGRVAWAEEKATERGEIQKELLELGKARKSHVAEVLKKRAEEGAEKTLDEAIIDSLHEQAEKKGYSFEK